MIQFSLCMLMGFYACSLFMHWFRSFNSMHRLLHASLVIPSLMDVLTKDVQACLPENISCNNQGMHLRIAQDKKVSWYCKQRKVFRKQQRYDLNEKRWKRPVVAPVSNDINSCRFKKDEQNQLIQIQVNYTGKMHTCIIGFCNGRIL